MDIDAAKTEIKRVETVLRSRYNYAHPVFNYLAAALKHLEGDLPEAPPPPAEAEPQETEEQLEAEAEEAVAVGEAEVSESAGASGEATVEPKPPTRRARRGAKYG